MIRHRALRLRLRLTSTAASTPLLGLKLVLLDRPIARAAADSERVDAIVQVRAEAAVADKWFERTVGGRNQPEIDRDGLVPAEPLEEAFFEHAQQLGLRDERGVGDFVEEERAFVGQLETAR